MKGIWSVKNGGLWRWALVGPDGVALNQMVSISASVSLPLHHKVQKLYSGTGSPGWSRAIKWLWCGVVVEASVWPVIVVIIVAGLCLWIYDVSKYTVKILALYESFTSLLNICSGSA